MIEDGLYDKYGCPIPDVLLGQHVAPRKSGHIDTRPGPLMAGVDAMKITVYGRGGHASMPHMSVDPTVLASHIVVRLQTIVSREVTPGSLAVVTVTSLHVGKAINVISDHALIELSIRSADSEARDSLISAIKRIVVAECNASDSPRDPVFEVVSSIPAMYNDPYTTHIINRSFSAHFGHQNHNPSCEIVPASEDFSHLASAIGKPYCFWFFGGQDTADWEEKSKANRLDSVPSLHSALFAPAIQPTLSIGVEALVVATMAVFSGDANGPDSQGVAKPRG
ncbi:peptidase M20, dimerization domain-containing protein [Trichoderma evansii]